MLSAMSKNREVSKTIMIKTLRITSIVAAILAVVFFVIPAVSGFRGDKQTKKFLNSPGVIERFKQAKADYARTSTSQISPLVKQAEAFALYLNPPVPKSRPAPVVRNRSVVKPRPPKVSAKFKLIGTSFYALHPEQSMVLIDQPGKGLGWVRQSSSVGHLVIEEVKDGAVVVRDGQRTFELVPARSPKKSLLQSPLSGKTPSKPVLPVSTETRADIASSGPRQISAEESAAWGKLMDELKTIDVESGKTDSEIKELIAEKTEALMEKYVSGVEAMRVSAEEAEKLDRLGKQLKIEDVRRATGRLTADPNRARNYKSRSPPRRTESRPRRREVNSPEEE